MRARVFVRVSGGRYVIVVGTTASKTPKLPFRSQRIYSPSVGELYCQG